MKTLLQKMFYKPQYSLCILHLPKDLKKEFNEKADTNLNNKYLFLLSFYSKSKDLEKEINEVKDALEDKGILWIAYPKAKALDTDLNRDILHSLMKDYGFDGVSLVSLGETWSAMRFKS